MTNETTEPLTTYEQLHASVFEEKLHDATLKVVRKMIADMEKELLPLINGADKVPDHIKFGLVDKSFRSIVANLIVYGVHPASRDYFMADLERGIAELNESEMIQLGTEASKIVENLRDKQKN